MNKSDLKSYLFPLGFIVLYGSGFVFTQYGLQSSSAMIFLFIRFLIASIILGLIVFIFQIKVKLDKKEVFHIAVAGILTVGVFSVGVYLSIQNGINASLSALIIALQPILVSILAVKFLNEKATFRKYLGLFLGLLGVSFVVYKNLEFEMDYYLGLFWSLFALFGLTFGSFYQKRFCSNMNLYLGGFIQTIVCTLFVLPFLFFEKIYLDINFEFIISLLYMSIVVSIGALSLLYIMIKKHNVSKVSSLFYMIPVSASVMSFFLFGSNINISMIIGIFFVLCAIVLINFQK